MKKFLFRLTLTILPILILLVSVNYFGDKGSLFQNAYEKEMVNIIASGQYVTNIGNYSERVFQKELIGSNHVHPNLVVLGSSRTMPIHSDFFPEHTLLNNSVVGAVIQDIIGYYQLYKNLDKLPEKIIIGIDPWVFNEYEPEKLWIFMAEHYHEFMGSEQQQFYHLSKYKQLVSFSYFQQSFSRFMKVIKRKKIPPKPTNSKLNSWPTRLTDGSLAYHKALVNITSEEVEKNISSFMEGGIYGLDFYNELSEKKINEFKKVIDDMFLHNIEIEFILIPYPPKVFDRIQEKYPLVHQTEQYIYDFAILHHIKVYGTYNPYTLGMDNSFFIDGMHCNEKGIERVLQEGTKLP